MELTHKLEALLKSLHTRHGRRKAGLCLCEGVRAVGELYARRPDLVKFTVATAAAAEAVTIPGECVIVPPEKMAALTGAVTPQGVIAVAAIPPPPGENERPSDPFLLALDQLGDPGNFGTICRSARAAGLTELWLTAGSIDPFGDKAVRAAMGSQFAMKLRTFPDLGSLREAAAQTGYSPLVLTDPHDGENCFTAPGLFDRTVLVIGGEANGATMLAGSRHVRIPMPGEYESLNAAQAATIFLFEFVRRTTAAGGSSC